MSNRAEALAREYSRSVYSVLKKETAADYCAGYRQAMKDAADFVDKKWFHFEAPHELRDAILKLAD